MSQVKAKHIYVLGGYNKNSAAVNLTYANAVHSGIFTDPEDYPEPPIDEPTFKGAIDAFSQKITAALDGGKKAIADRNQQEEIVINMLRELGNYVEKACKNDMATFLKSGFRAKSPATGPKRSLSRFIRSVTPGPNSGTLLIVINAVDGAAAYQFRFAPTVNGAPGTWTTQLITKTRPGTTITGLTPGATYAIQVRSFADGAGFTDWSDSVTRVCT
jgi:hypothetical protein